MFPHKGIWPPRGVKYTSFIGRQRRATLADKESRPAEEHAGSHVCHHGIENGNRLGFPAELKHTTPELSLTPNTLSWWEPAMGMTCEGILERGAPGSMRLQPAPSRQNNKHTSLDFVVVVVVAKTTPPFLSPANTIFSGIARWREDCTFRHAVTEEIVLSQVTLLWQKVPQNSRC